MSPALSSSLEVRLPDINTTLTHPRYSLLFALCSLLSALLPRITVFSTSKSNNMATSLVKREDSETSMADLPQHIQPPASGLVKMEPADEDTISLRPEDPNAEQTTEYPSAWELAE